MRRWDHVTRMSKAAALFFSSSPLLGVLTLTPLSLLERNLLLFFCILLKHFLTGCKTEKLLTFSVWTRGEEENMRWGGRKRLNEGTKQQGILQFWLAPRPVWFLTVANVSEPDKCWGNLSYTLRGWRSSCRCPLPRALRGMCWGKPCITSERSMVLCWRTR